MKFLITLSLIAFSSLAFSQNQLNCVASTLYHQTMSVQLGDDGTIRIQKYFEGNLLGAELIARRINESNPLQFILVGKGGEKEYLTLAPGAFSPQAKSKKTHVVLSPTLESNPETLLLYNCSKN